MNDWRLISTAPFGEDVIAFFPESREEYRVMIVHRFDDDPDEWYQQDADQCPAAIEYPATHWMPLPNPPTVQP